MRILIVTPAPRGSRKGNRITAVRYGQILRKLGHRVAIAEQFDRGDFDVLIALHARKSHASVRRYRRLHPLRPIVVVLTGTDLYHDLSRSATARQSLAWATRVVVLQPDGIRHLPTSVRGRTRAILQSCAPPAVRPLPSRDTFEICVIGHLRPVKDPFRAALASRRLPSESRIAIVQLGAALSTAMENFARAEERRNPRYRWLGDVSRAKAMRILARSRLVVVSSKLEGGPNVISEALACGTPVISTRISGSIGMLGERYPGFFEVGDTAGLAKLLRRCEVDSSFYESLRAHGRRLWPLVEPAMEAGAWRELLKELELANERNPTETAT